MARTTIRDVARAAGVSVTTVSHALNGKGRVDAATRERIAHAAERLGYRPSRAARGLRSGRTGTIALLLPHVEPEIAQDEISSLEYYMRLAAAVARSAFAAGSPVLLTPPLRGAGDLRDLGVDGGIVCDPMLDDVRAALFDALELPLVTIERDPRAPERPWVVRADNESNTRALLDHLADSERIALLGAGSGWGWADDTARAYVDWCAEHGREPIVEEASMRTQERSAYQGTLHLLQTRRVDAIVAVAERYVGGVLAAARARGLRVPEDLRVAVAVDSVQAREAHPRVTAIDLRPDVQGEAAVRLLLERLAGEERSAPEITPAELHLRASTQR